MRIPNSPPFIPAQSGKSYLLGFVCVLLVTLFNWFALPFIGYWSVSLIYLMLVFLLAFFTPLGAVLLAATLSALLWNYLFIPPRFTFQINTLHDSMMFIMYFVLALGMGSLTNRIRHQERQVRKREQQTLELYRLTQKLAEANSLEEIVDIVIAECRQHFGAEVAILLKDKATPEVPKTPLGPLLLNAKEHSVAQWAIEHGQSAGHLTDILPAAELFHVPLQAQTGTVGVLSMNLPQETISQEQHLLLQAFASQIALVLERNQLRMLAEETRMVQASERLYQTLLSSISHELRTPITAIRGALSNLKDVLPKMLATPSTMIQESLDDMDTETQRLNRLVANLLDISRLEAGYIKPHQGWYELSEILERAVQNLAKELADYPLEVAFESPLPLVYCDFGLIEQVFTNLLHNITVHNPPQTLIRVGANQQQQQWLITVEDNGKGVPPFSMPHLFDKFYRGPDAFSGGMGLGLSICKGFIDAQGGTLTYSQSRLGGACFTLLLPNPPLPPIPKDEDMDE